jgi:hypothetical protein
MNSMKLVTKWHTPVRTSPKTKFSSFPPYTLKGISLVQVVYSTIDNKFCHLKNSTSKCLTILTVKEWYHRSKHSLKEFLLTTRTKTRWSIRGQKCQISFTISLLFGSSFFLSCVWVPVSSFGPCERESLKVRERVYLQSWLSMAASPFARFKNREGCLPPIR